MEETQHSKIIPLAPDSGTLSVPLSLNVEGATIKMKLLSEEQIDTLSSNSSGVSLNALLAIIGIEAGLLCALYSDSIKPENIPYFKISIAILVILMIYFGVTAFFEWKAVRKAKLRIKEQSKTISVVSPIILDNNSNEGS